MAALFGHAEHMELRVGATLKGCSPPPPEPAGRRVTLVFRCAAWSQQLCAVHADSTTCSLPDANCSYPEFVMLPIGVLLSHADVIHVARFVALVVCLMGCICGRALLKLCAGVCEGVAPSPGRGRSAPTPTP